MAFDVPPLPSTQPDWNTFQIWWQLEIDKLEEQIAQAALNGIQLKIGLGYTSPSSILTGTDAGASATITIASHTRVYGDGSQVAITGGSITGLAYSTAYAVYYDDTTLSDTTPTFMATTTLVEGQANYAAGRHSLGIVTTPAAAGAPTSGGTRPPGGGAGPPLP